MTVRQTHRLDREHEYLGPRHPRRRDALKVGRKHGFPLELDTSFRSGRADSKLTRHAQSIARTPSSPTPTGPDPYIETPVLALTRHHVHDPKQAGVIVATLPAFRSDGGSIAKAKTATDAHDPDPVATIVAFDRSQSLEPAGGSQALGHKLAVAFCSEKPDNDPYVQWYDLADTFRCRLATRPGHRAEISLCYAESETCVVLRCAVGASRSHGAPIASSETHVRTPG